MDKIIIDSANEELDDIFVSSSDMKEYIGVSCSGFGSASCSDGCKDGGKTGGSCSLGCEPGCKDGCKDGCKEYCKSSKNGSSQS